LTVNWNFNVLEVAAAEARWLQGQAQPGARGACGNARVGRTGTLGTPPRNPGPQTPMASPPTPLAPGLAAWPHFLGVSGSFRGMGL